MPKDLKSYTSIHMYVRSRTCHCPDAQCWFAYVYAAWAHLGMGSMGYYLPNVNAPKDSRAPDVLWLPQHLHTQCSKLEAETA